jgi:hypothetical protein
MVRGRGPPRGIALLSPEPDAAKAEHGWFTEGFETRDLKEAKALFDALSS